MSHFFIVDNPEGTKRIECMFVVYREKFKHHPSFLKDLEGDEKNGFNTKFFFIIEDDLTDAESLLSYYKEKFDTLLYEIEEDDNRWEDFLFKDNVLSYWK